MDPLRHGGRVSRRLVDRRLLKKQSIAAGEKIYSFFEPPTEWINQGKFPGY